MPDRRLAGAVVLNTRPTQTAAELSAAVESRGGTIVTFPVLEIASRDRESVIQHVKALPDADVTIFISRNAAELGGEFASGRVAAIGPATASALESQGLAVDIHPAHGFDSEHLLAEPAFVEAKGMTIRIVRGDGGRDLLESELSQLGARVDYVDVYERRLPTHPESMTVSVADRITAGGIDAIVVMSVQSLDHLDALLPERCSDAFHRTPLVTPATRVIKELHARGPDRPATLAASPRPDDIVDAIVTATTKPRRTLDK